MPPRPSGRSFTGHAGPVQAVGVPARPAVAPDRRRATRPSGSGPSPPGASKTLAGHAQPGLRRGLVSRRQAGRHRSRRQDVRGNGTWPRRPRCGRSKAHANVVYAVAYSPKGDLLATGGRRQARQVLEPRRRQGTAQERRSRGAGLLPVVPSRRHQAGLGLGRQDDPDLERRRRQGAGQARRPSRRRLLGGLQSRRQAAGLGRLRRATSSSGTWRQPSRSGTRRSRPGTMAYGVAWSPDGKQLAVAASDNKAYIFQVP